MAFAQLIKIARFNAARKPLVEGIEDELRGCPGLLLAHRYPDTEPNYWQYPVQLHPEETSLTAMEVHRLCFEEERVRVGYYHEVNYLERVFQDAERRRMTPFGLPLPGYLHYELGLCPKAEDAAKRTLLFFVHHSRDPQALRQQARALRRTMERHT